MSFSVEAFRRIFSGGARPNLFAGFLQAPDGLGLNTRDAGQFTWMCQTSSIPGSTVGIIEQPYMGRVYKVPGNRTFEDLTTTVLNDEDFALRRLMEAWDDRINGRTNNTQASTPGAFFTSGDIDGFTAPKLSIMQYARDGEPIREYEFMGAWPSAVGPIELGWDTNDAVETYDITWTYSWYETKDTIGGIVDGLFDMIKGWTGTGAGPEDFSTRIA